ncbi:MAG: Gfo/Idh/MocA family oxidoreductase [Candidatus Latescibacteria bacterium]|nr:Gfo/Idh/MocA family oxidoreductase [Candidatus Latescibacterota bacterium]MBT4140358.1 Gfo/Idh/MocA family oxidoreductase [Candidatus Latescibacterota bacterium]MBT5829718.1 Gfo/Idh/MocA family oxidoreductase [Candidatus Latescibacterota bacterium]
MVSIGIVGLGFMGMTHYRGIKKVRGGKVVALCTRDKKKRSGDWRGIGGNFGEPGGKEDLGGIQTYEDVDDLLADPKIDLVDLCLPTDQHCDIAIRAMRAGKHVLVEKPIALSLKDADRMVRVSQETGQLLMVAHVLPFFPEFAYLKDVIDSKEYGAVKAAHFKRIISAPNWSASLSNMARSGGPGVDLHIHDTHYILLLFGKPDHVRADGRLVDEQYAEYLTTSYRFANQPNLCITCASGAISQRGRAFSHGFEVYLEDATVAFEFATLAGKPALTMPVTLLTSDGKARKPRLGAADPVVAFTREIQAAVDSVRSGKVNAALSGENGANALRLCFKEVSSVLSGRAVRV